MPINEEHIVVSIDINNTGFMAGSKAVEAQMNRMKIAALGLQSALRATKLTLMATGAAFAGALAPMGLASKMVAGFDDNLRRAAAIGGEEFKNSMDEMTQSINQMAIEFGEGQEQISQAVIEFAKTGYDFQTIFGEILRPTMQMAIANQTDVAEAAELANYAFVLWGESGKDAAEMLDIMHRAASLSVMDIEDLGEAFEYSGSMASISSVSFEEYMATAAALSQVAAKTGSVFGTLITRLMAVGEEMEQILGDDAIMKEGVLDMTALIKNLGDISENEFDKMKEALSVYGLRSGRIVAQLAASHEQYEDILYRLVEGEEQLGEASQFMSMSIERLMSILKNMITAAMSTDEVMSSIRSALAGLAGILQTTAFQEQLGYLIEMSAQFVSHNAVRLINMVARLMDVMVDFYPIVLTLADTFITLMNAVYPILKYRIFVVLGMGIMFMHKLMPGVISSLGRMIYQMIGAAATGKSLTAVVGGLAGTMAGLRLSIAGAFGGFMMILMSTDPIIQAIGAITATVMALATAWQLVSIFGAMAMPAKFAFMAAAGGAAALLSFELAGRVRESGGSFDMPEYEAPRIPTGGGGGDTVINNYINDPSKDEMYTSMAVDKME